MSDIKTIDARGLSCPQPALKTKQTISKLETGKVEVLVDSKTSRENVTRLAQKAGWNVNVEELPDGSFKLVLTK